MLEDWVGAVCAELDIDEVIDRNLILDMTRDVAHGVARPAAPSTAYLIGLAAGAPPVITSPWVAPSLPGAQRQWR